MQTTQIRQEDEGPRVLRSTTQEFFQLTLAPMASEKDLLHGLVDYCRRVTDWGVA